MLSLLGKNSNFLKTNHKALHISNYSFSKHLKHIRMFGTALFIRAKSLKQPTYPSAIK